MSPKQRNTHRYSKLSTSSSQVSQERDVLFDKDIFVKTLHTDSDAMNLDVVGLTRADGKGM